MTKFIIIESFSELVVLSGILKCIRHIHLFARFQSGILHQPGEVQNMITELGLIFSELLLNILIVNVREDEKRMYDLSSCIACCIYDRILQSCSGIIRCALI